VTTAPDLARARRAYVIAPAGCGKTELIAAAVAADAGRRQLVLTHTHAGVAALRDRLRRHGVAKAQARVETIAGFALRFASAYPSTSRYPERQPRDAAWAEVYEAAGRVLETRTGRQILAASYHGVYVDEYQDCVTDQHALILAIADVLPTRVLGDPLQGIFDFAGQQIVDWNHLDDHFERLPDLDTPWRWRMTNPDLGDWLLAIRPGLLAGARPDFRSGPVQVQSNTEASQVSACGRLIAENSVVAIRKWARNAHSIASRLGGNYTSMEEMESKDLLTHANMLDQRQGTDRALATIDFAALSVTQVGKHLNTAKTRLKSGALPSATQGAGNQLAVEALREVAQDPAPTAVAAALSAISHLPGSKTFRRELLAEMQSTLRLAASMPGRPWVDVAWEVRDRARRNGRTLERRIVSRTLLIKGLEFDHAIVLDADELDAKHLYVAMTRGSKTLTVLTAGADPF
jgi:DNA helicase-2/ATP-dependent DNA helicase PcrA